MKIYILLLITLFTSSILYTHKSEEMIYRNDAQQFNQYK